jgi:protocatechuate 3,4-dioxygenase beta subunit
MKQLIALSICVFAFGNSFGQQPAAPQKTATAPQRGASKANRTVVTGTITDSRYRPIAGAQVFVYPPDSSIVASAYTDASGVYETNSVMPGTYRVKVLYPSNKAVNVNSVVIKRGAVQLNIKAEPPANDTIMTYADFIPKPAEKKKK